MLWNASEHDKSLLPMLKMIGSSGRFFRGRTLAKIIAVLVALVGLICVLTFVPWELTIEGRGSLLPENRRTLYAPLQGTIVKVPVDHGTVVKEGDLLAKLDSLDLDKDLQKLRSQEQEAKAKQGQFHAQAEKANSSRGEEYAQFKAQEQEAKIQAESARKQIDIIEEQLKLMEIHSPQDGVVTTWEPQKTLQGRPVEVGQELLQVAATGGDWVMEVEVPDDDMGPFLEAKSRLEAEIKAGTKPPGSTLQAYFVTATDPEHRYRGYVQRIASKAETVETKHVVKVTVAFSTKVRDEFLAKNKIAPARRRGPSADRVRAGPARLCAAPRRRPRLLRDRAVPLAVPPQRLTGSRTSRDLDPGSPLTSPGADRHDPSQETPRPGRRRIARAVGRGDPPDPGPAAGRAPQQRGRGHPGRRRDGRVHPEVAGRPPDRGEPRVGSSWRSARPSRRTACSDSSTGRRRS